MTDQRIKEIAKILVDYSTKIKENDYVQIIAGTQAEPLVKELYKLVLQKNAYPVLKTHFDWQSFTYYKNVSEKQLEHFPEVAFEEMKKTDVIIFISSSNNTRQLTNIDPNLISKRQKVNDPISKERLKKRWVIFDFPSSGLAQEADMSTEEFEDFVYSSCILNWEEKAKELDKAINIMSKGKTVRITGEDTDLTFSIEGRMFIKGDGTMNMPDGEIFTAPVENTVNGHIKFTYPAIYGGREVNGVELEFKDGKIIKATAIKNEEFLNTMINTDKGSKFLGEFGIGLNSSIDKPIKNILFDEKQDKTIHLAIGSAYPECNGTNKSAVHWDIIKDMRNNGKIYLDDNLVYENGEFL